MPERRSAGIVNEMADSALGADLEETVDRLGIYPRLDGPARAHLRDIGIVRATETGQVLFREGEDEYDFFLIESGAIAIVAGYGQENRVIAVHGEHRFIGELGLLRGESVYLTAVVTDPGEVVQVPAGRMRELVRGDEALGGLILNALLARRSGLIESEAGVRLIGSRYSPETSRLREFLARNRVPLRWSDPDVDDQAQELLLALGVAPDEGPVVLAAGRVLRQPSNDEIARTLGIGSRHRSADVCDVLVVGGGPSGLAASVYAASEGLKTQLIDAVAVGGQASTSSRIENYMGFPNGISGSELAERAALQAEKFGARLLVPCEACRLERRSDHFEVALSGGGSTVAKAIIVATGARYRRLAVPDLDRFEGLGVFYAATESEALRCIDQPVLIVGGGNSAGQAAIFLSRRVGSCRLVIRGESLATSMSSYLVDEIARRPNIEVMSRREIVALNGGRELESVVLREPAGDRVTEFAAAALFVFIGALPHTQWLAGRVATDESGFLLTGAGHGEQLVSPTVDGPLFLETSEPGIFAVGDVRSGSVKRVASAAGEGAMAISMVHERLARNLAREQRQVAPGL
jgi:thioredoxin reductase (NADPH)